MTGKRVLIVGGGVSGLSAAHELVERGFKVTLHERRGAGCDHDGDGHVDEAYGGKARSYRVGRDPKDEVAHAAKGAKSHHAGDPPPLRLQRQFHDPNATHRQANSPGEHGFRFIPAFYRHLPDTMARIPSSDPRKSVASNLTSPGLDQFATYRSADLIPFLSDFPHGEGISALDRMLTGSRTLGLTPEDILFYFGRLWQVLTSCQERRLEELERTSWATFVDSDNRSVAFRDYFGFGSTRNLVASRAKEANARVIAEVSIQTWMPVLFPRPWNFADAGDRILNGPTQDVLIQPWIDYLRKRGVRFVPNSQLKHIEVADGEVKSLAFGPGRGGPEEEERLQRATIKGRHLAFKRRRAAAAKAPVEDRVMEFDYVVLAVPVEQVIDLITPEMEAADPSLALVKKLEDDLGWMSGIQFYLNDVPKKYADLRGHVNFVDSPWALTSILQSESWQPKYQNELSEDAIGGVLSVCVSDWKAAGFNKKTAEDCTPDEVAREVWEQIVRALPDLGSYDRRVSGYALDEDVWEQMEGGSRAGKNLLQNAEPLLINKIKSWANRPLAGTKIRNLVLAGDFVRTNTGLACMEGANESARAAVNEILLRSGSNEDLCQVWELPEPPFARAAQVRDRARFNRGEPWRDLPGSPMSLVVDGGSHVANFIQNLLSRP